MIPKDQVTKIEHMSSDSIIEKLEELDNRLKKIEEIEKQLKGIKAPIGGDHAIDPHRIPDSSEAPRETIEELFLDPNDDPSLLTQGLISERKQRLEKRPTREIQVQKSKALAQSKALEQKAQEPSPEVKALQAEREKYWKELKEIISDGLLEAYDFLEPALELKRQFQESISAEELSLVYNKMSEDDKRKEKEKFLRNEASKLASTRHLNEKVRNIIVNMALALPDNPPVEVDTYSSKAKIAIYLEEALSDKAISTDYNKMKDLCKNMLLLKRRSERAEVYNKWAERITSVIVLGEGIFHPLEEVPFINLIAVPVMAALRFAYTITWGLAIKRDPGLGTEATQAKLKAYAASNVVGAVTVVGLISFAIAAGVGAAAVAAVLLPLTAISITVSSVLWAWGAIKDFTAEYQSGNKNTQARPHLLASKAATVFHTVASVVFLTMAAIALMTPVGWAAGAGLIVFAALSVASVWGALFVSKWQGKKAEAILEKEKALEHQELEKEKAEEHQLQAARKSVHAPITRETRDTHVITVQPKHEIKQGEAREVKLDLTKPAISQTATGSTHFSEDLKRVSEKYENKRKAEVKSTESKTTEPSSHLPQGSPQRIEIQQKTPLRIEIRPKVEAHPQATKEVPHELESPISTPLSAVSSSESQERSSNRTSNLNIPSPTETRESTSLSESKYKERYSPSGETKEKYSPISEFKERDIPITESKERLNKLSVPHQAESLKAKPHEVLTSFQSTKLHQTPERLHKPVEPKTTATQKLNVPTKTKTPVKSSQPSTNVQQKSEAPPIKPRQILIQPKQPTGGGKDKTKPKRPWRPV